MSQPLRRSYRFATESQWQACLFAGADRGTAEARRGLRPFAPYQMPPIRHESPGGHAPAISDAGELLWRDDEGSLQRLGCRSEPIAVPAPAAIADARRLVTTPGTLWAAGRNRRLEAFDIDSLTRLFTADLDGRRVIDFAADGRDGLYVLVAADGYRRIVHVDCAGKADAEIANPQLSGASSLAFLGRPGKLVLLAGRDAKLFWLDPRTSEVDAVVPIAALRPCFCVTAIGSDGCSRLFVAGRDGRPAGRGGQIVLADADGNFLGVVPLDGTPNGVVADRASLYVTTNRGLQRFDPGQSVPKGASELRATVLTPLLRSPAATPQKWIRIEAKADLPPGCSLEISYASPPGGELEELLRRRLDDASVPPSHRIEQWRRELKPRKLVFHADAALPAGREVTLSAPLQDVAEPWLWVQATLLAAPGGRVPRLAELAVLYPGQTLIEHLPAVYRSRELESADFLRALVGTLEATTEDLDHRIADLGRNIDPATASDAWLDYVAGWLGLPWDDALSGAQKRRIASGAAGIAAGYGTRAGIEALLDALMPERPRRYRIADLTADFGIARIGGDGCAGSPLPVLLAGLPATAAELGNKAILGKARLPCGDPEPEWARLMGRIRIQVAADAAERAAWSPWLGTLVAGLLPATVRAEIGWLPLGALGDPVALAADDSLDAAPVAHLGSDSVTGTARLAGRQRTTLPQRISPDSGLH